MMICARCTRDVDELWATIEMFSRVGNFRALDLCRQCTAVAYAFVLKQPLKGDQTMSLLWDLPIRDNDDIDDAEHHTCCPCAECVGVLVGEWRREERLLYGRESA
jgi:hypothetical protein